MSTPVGYTLADEMTRRHAIGTIRGRAAAPVVAALVPSLPQDPANHSQEPAGRPYAVFFGGLLLTGVGSAYYHWGPGNPRLAWDRLPLAITIMGLLDAVVAERIGMRAAVRLLGPLVAVAALSVGYRAWTEQRGAGDLRLYAPVQFFPLAAIPLMLWWLPPRYTGAVGVLAAAAVLRAGQGPGAGGRGDLLGARVVSRHTLKHLLAALAGYAVLLMLERRRAVVTRTS